MNTFKNHAWDSDIEAAMLSLTRKLIADNAYWFDTIEIVEAGYDPDTRKPITIDALEAWVTRCKTTPAEEGNTDDTPSTPRFISPKNRTVPSDGPR